MQALHAGTASSQHVGGIPTAVVICPATLPADLVCSICSDMCAEPVITPCHHVFCSACVAAARQHTPSMLCPIDRQRLPAQLPLLRNACPALHRVWEGVKLRCPYAAVIDCEWTGCADGYTQHAAECKSKARQRESQQQQRAPESNAPLVEVQAAKHRLEVEKQQLQAQLLSVTSQHAMLCVDVAELRRDNQRLRGERDARTVRLDPSYAYGPHRVVELSRLILQHLEDPPSSIQTNRIFNCVQSIHAAWRRGHCDGDEDAFRRNLMTLLAAAGSSCWFTPRQHEMIDDMLRQAAFGSFERLARAFNISF